MKVELIPNGEMVREEVLAILCRWFNQGGGKFAIKEFKAMEEHITTKMGSGYFKGGNSRPGSNY